MRTEMPLAIEQHDFAVMAKYSFPAHTEWGRVLTDRVIDRWVQGPFAASKIERDGRFYIQIVASPVPDRARALDAAELAAARQ